MNDPDKEKPMATTSQKKRVTFEYRGSPDDEVYLSGSPWQWDPQAKRMKQGDGRGHFSRSVLLPPGKYEYKYRVNGRWCVDPENACRWTVNPYGTLNNIIEVK